MKRKILVSVLVTIFAWSMCGVGDVQAEGLDDLPSTGELVGLGVAAAVVVTVIIVAIVTSGDDEKAGEKEDINMSAIDEYVPSVRVDPILALGRDTVGAGVAFSF